MRERESFRSRLLLPAILLLVACAHAVGPSAWAQGGGARKALPSPERVVADYLKATGGKKRHAVVRDATYDYELWSNGRRAGRARTLLRAATFERTETTLEREETLSGSNGRSAWRRDAGGQLRTLTDAEANAAKLRATLSASRLLDYKRLGVLARTVAVETINGEPAYVLEFSARSGARLRCWFGANSRLLLKISDDASRQETTLADYRAEQGLLEPHRLEVRAPGAEPLVMLLQKVGYNTGLDAALFDPPASSEQVAIDIPALLRELEQNQKKIDERVAEYSFVEKVTEREINNRGEVTKVKVSVYEIYPLVGSQPVRKLISEDGVPLSPERAAKQDKEIAEYLSKYEREREKKVQKSEAEKKKKEEEEDERLGVDLFLRASEFVSPRRERREGRELIVFDFRPREGFRPKTRAESIVSKLAGIMWIDPVDKVVVRLETRLAESFKVGGGLAINISPGSSISFEQVRQADGVWLPRFMQLNFKARFLLFKGVEANQTREFSDYKRFNAEASGYRLDAPKP